MEKHDLSLRSLYGDGWSAPALNPNEHVVLTAVSLLQEQGVTDLRLLAKAKDLSGGHISTWAIAFALRRLKKRGLVTAEMRITEDGERALARARAEGKTLADVSDQGPVTESPR